MPRRLATLLLALTLVVAGIGSAACPGGNCFSAAKKMDCCPTGGLHAPSCCPPAEELSQRATTPAADRPIQHQLAAAVLHVVPVVLAAPQALPSGAPRAIDPAAGPPGSLLAQHTSLLV